MSALIVYWPELLLAAAFFVSGMLIAKSRFWLREDKIDVDMLKAANSRWEDPNPIRHTPRRRF